MNHHMSSKMKCRHFLSYFITVTKHYDQTNLQSKTFSFVLNSCRGLKSMSITVGSMEAGRRGA